MKNKLKTLLVAVTIAALSACGDGASDVADAFIGKWKSKCFAYKAQDGNTYYQTGTTNLSKDSAAQLTANYSNAVAHSDSACSNILGNITSASSIKISIGAETVFLGLQSKEIVATYQDGNARRGYIAVDNERLFIVVTDDSGEKPFTWGRSSPYTKL
ncbi:MAG: hypothetical protein IPF65_09930 [Polaromonas sp.]|jgi:hypothetical protein|nr:hypothetical protein [Polaromonas sp.]MBP7309177.1 hypothetical protein [Polaromonas sp.]